MAIPKRVIDTGVKTAKEISRKAYGVGVVHGTKNWQQKWHILGCLDAFNRSQCKKDRFAVITYV